jgi:hypothetical protein
VSGDESDETPDYEPNNEQLRKVYRAALEASNNKLIVRMRKHGSVVAQESQTSQDALHGYLRELEAKNYARQQSGAPGGAKTQTAWRIKPLCADPDQWVYRRHR